MKMKVEKIYFFSFSHCPHFQIFELDYPRYAFKALL